MTTTLQKLSLALGFTTLLAVGTLAIAAEPRGPADTNRLDTNKDGAIDFAEMQARRSDLTIEQFNAMDKDHNGLLNREELRASMQERMQARANERFKKLDTNGDGGLSQQELNAGREKAEAERFKKLDTDGDGKLSEAELNAGRQAFGNRPGRMGPGDHHGPGPHPGGPPPAAPNGA